MSGDRKTPVKAGNHTDVAAFLSKVAQTPVKTSGKRGRLLFAMDATASREPTWDAAMELQAQMFSETASLGGLSVQLCYYRGFREFHHSSWCDDAGTLLREMTGVMCLGGQTQISRVLSHALEENRREPVQALVFIGDALEEDADALCEKAGKLGLVNVPVFIFQEGTDPTVRSIFSRIAKLSGGAFAPFDKRSAAQLKSLLSAVAVFAAGGRRALEDFSQRAGGEVLRLTRQLK